MRLLTRCLARITQIAEGNERGFRRMRDAARAGAVVTRRQQGSSIPPWCAYALGASAHRSREQDPVCSARSGANHFRCDLH